MCNDPKRAVVGVRSGVECDPCLLPLLRLLNDGGFPTSPFTCCQHGTGTPVVIRLKDGRTLTLAGEAVSRG